MGFSFSFFLFPFSVSSFLFFLSSLFLLLFVSLDFPFLSPCRRARKGNRERSEEKERRIDRKGDKRERKQKKKRDKREREKKEKGKKKKRKTKESCCRLLYSASSSTLCSLFSYFISLFSTSTSFTLLSFPYREDERVVPHFLWSAIMFAL